MKKEGGRVVVKLSVSASAKMREYSEREKLPMAQAVSQYIERVSEAEAEDLEGLRGEIAKLNTQILALEEDKTALSRELSAIKEQATSGGGTFLVPHRR